jgi:iron complex outermembrane receptor protein
MGLESSLSLKYIKNSFSSVLTAGYTYTKATGYDSDNDLYGDKQLIYVPVHQANGSFRLKYGNVYSTVRSNATGRRYTSADNKEFLHAFIVNDLTAGLRHTFSWGVADVSLSVDNIFNAEYQTMAYYPLPGRTWLVRLLIQTSK